MASWGFLNSALQSGLNSATNFGRLSIAHDQNRRAEDQFQTEMLDSERARQREQELNQVQARIARALSTQRGGGRPETMLPQRQEQPAMRMADEDYWAERLADPEVRGRHKTTVENLRAMLDDPDNAEPELVRDSLNEIYGDIINQGGPEGSRKSIKGWVPSDDDEEGFVPVLDVERPDGSRYAPPLTENRSDDPDDPVATLRMPDLMSDLDTQRSMANIYDSLPELQARAVALGDDSELTRLYQQLEAQAGEERWRERQQLLQEYGIDDKMIQHLLGLDELGVRNDYQTQQGEREQDYALDRMGMEQQNALARMQEEQGFEREQGATEFDRDRELEKLKAGLRGPEFVTTTDGRAVMLPRNPGEPALPVNERLMDPQEAKRQALSGGQGPTKEAARQLEQTPTEQPLKLPIRTGGSGQYDIAQKRVDLFLKYKEAAAQASEGSFGRVPMPSDDEIMRQVDKLLQMSQGQQGQQGQQGPRQQTMLPRGNVMDGIGAYGVR